MSVIHIHRVPTHVLRIEGFGIHWCFTCRKRVAFTKTIHVPDDPMSYYGPHVTVECEPMQHVDGDLFPGTTRGWVDV